MELICQHCGYVSQDNYGMIRHLAQDYFEEEDNCCQKSVNIYENASSDFKDLHIKEGSI